MCEILFDIEIMGLNLCGGDRLVEIGGVEFFNYILIGKFYYVYINLQWDMFEEVFWVYGFLEEFLLDKLLFDQVVDEFFDFVGDVILVIYNVVFDMGFINFELEKVGCWKILNIQVIDIFEIVWCKYFMGFNFFDVLCFCYGIDNLRCVKYGVFLDVEIFVEVYLELIGGCQIGLNLMLDDDFVVGFVVVFFFVLGEIGIFNVVLWFVLLGFLFKEDEYVVYKVFVDGMGDGLFWKKYG